MSGELIEPGEQPNSGEWHPAFNLDAQDYYSYLHEVISTYHQGTVQGLDTPVPEQYREWQTQQTYRDLVKIIITNSILDREEGWDDFPRQADNSITQDVTGFFLVWRTPTIIEELTKRGSLNQAERKWLTEEPNMIGKRLLELTAEKLFSDRGQEQPQYPDYREIVQFALIQSRRETMIQGLNVAIGLHSMGDIDLAQELCKDSFPSADALFDFEDNVYKKIVKNKKLISKIGQNLYISKSYEPDKDRDARAKTALHVFLYTRYLAGNDRESQMKILRRLGISTDFLNPLFISQFNISARYASTYCRMFLAKYIGLHFTDMNLTHFRDEV